MDLRHFRYFVAVAEELHFTRAAERLRISQPPLSKHIQEIEEQLGVTLLERTRRKVELTDAGRLFLDEARAVLAQAERAVTTGRRIALGELGRLRIGFTATAAYTPQFPRSVRAYRQALPDVSLSLSYMTTEAILEALTSETLDVGLIRPSPMLRLPSGLETLELVADQLMLVHHKSEKPGARKAPVPLASLAGEPFILRPRGRGSSFYEQVYDLCSLAGFSPKLSQPANEAPTILGLIASGMGVSILPASLRSIGVPDVRWTALSVKSGTLRSQVLLVYRTGAGSRTPQLQRFIEIVERQMAARQG